MLILCFWIEQKFPEKVGTAWVDLKEKPSLMSSREVFFISILPVRDLRLRKFQSAGQEIVGFWSTSLWGFHSTLGCVYRVGIHGAMAGTQVKALESP